MCFRATQLLDFISAHKETIACFPLSVFAHMAATIRELLGPEASIVQRRRGRGYDFKDAQAHLGDLEG